MWSIARAVLAAAMALGPASCSSETTELVGAAAASGSSGASAGSGGAGGGTAGCVPSTCQSKLYACGNCSDDDGDGLIDSLDPDCLGPCDDTEDVLDPTLPGAPGAPCRADCFWDDGNGSGNDDCHWDHRCDILAMAPEYPPEGPSCAYDPAIRIDGVLSCEEVAVQQSALCESVCLPLTPNGCDCFGCCEVPGAPTPVWVGSRAADGNAGACTAEALADPSRCKPCTMVQACRNPCDPCEICLGKPEPDPSCAGAGGAGGHECAPGAQACGRPGLGACASANEYCITGCCVTVPF